MDGPPQYRILVDTRERKPMTLPTALTCLSGGNPLSRRRTITRLCSEKRKLDTGDYALDGFEDRVLIERKGSLDEIAGNCLTPDRARFERCLKRLRDECARPIVFLEGDFTTLDRPSKHCREPALAVDALQRILLEYGVGLLVMPVSTPRHRRLAGEWIARYLINGVLACPTPLRTPPASTPGATSAAST